MTYKQRTLLTREAYRSYKVGMTVALRGTAFDGSQLSIDKYVKYLILSTMLFERAARIFYMMALDRPDVLVETNKEHLKKVRQARAMSCRVHYL